jgi:hypothetical protein
MEFKKSREAWANSVMRTNIYSLGEALDGKKGKGPPQNGEAFPRETEMIEGGTWNGFKTAKGYYGIAPNRIQEGDVITVLAGGLCLYALRPCKFLQGQILSSLSENVGYRVRWSLKSLEGSRYPVAWQDVVGTASLGTEMQRNHSETSFTFDLPMFGRCSVEGGAIDGVNMRLVLP